MFGVRELNVAIELWGIVFCAIGIVCTVLVVKGASRYRNVFMAGFSLEFVAAGGDMLGGLFRGGEGSLAWAMTHLGNYASYFANFFLVAVVTVYLCMRIEEAGGPAYRTWRRCALVLAAIMCVLTLAGAFFTIDAANLYQRTDWHWLSFAYGIAVGFVNAVIAIRHRAELGGPGLACLLVYTLVPALASLAQAFVYGINYVIIAGVVGLMVVFVEMLSHTTRVMLRQAEELAQSKVEVSESRIAVMVSQIQPHFLFNSLDTIYGLCDEDKELAKRAIASFSRYLRTNLDSLNRTTPVPIEKELEHVKTYLELERMSDEDRLEYVFDLQASGFEVPALSVQTLAENAVKHGLGGREQGGKVIVRTREQATEYTVAVIDDGIGFDVDTLAADGSQVGIANTRARVQAMCGGSLEITSKPNTGTSAIMHIPKGEVN